MTVFLSFFPLLLPSRVILFLFVKASHVIGRNQQTWQLKANSKNRSITSKSSARSDRRKKHLQLLITAFGRTRLNRSFGFSWSFRSLPKTQGASCWTQQTCSLLCYPLIVDTGWKPSWQRNLVFSTHSRSVSMTSPFAVIDKLHSSCQETSDCCGTLSQ